MSIYRALLRAELLQKLMFIFYLQSREGGAPAGKLGEGGGVGVAGEGWEVGGAAAGVAGGQSGGGRLRNL